MAGLLALLVLAIIVVLISGNGSGTSTTPQAASSSAGSGPFLTASTMPPGLGGRVVPSFDLTDARGGRITTTALRGRPYALTFLYAHCVDVCPLIGSEIHTALADLGPTARKMNVIAISVDPRGDTRRAVGRWLALHQEPANFHYLIGSQRMLAPIWKAFYVSPRSPATPTAPTPPSSGSSIATVKSRH